MQSSTGGLVKHCSYWILAWPPPPTWWRGNPEVGEKLCFSHTPLKAPARRRDLQPGTQLHLEWSFPPVALVASLTCSTFRPFRWHQTTTASDCAGPIHLVHLAHLVRLHPSRKAASAPLPATHPLHRSHHPSESLQWEPIDLLATGAWAMVPRGAVLAHACSCQLGVCLCFLLVRLLMLGRSFPAPVQVRSPQSPNPMQDKAQGRVRFLLLAGP
ncbi:hypothetical protein EDB80DRAFT_29599 [Ilyonectria destructans]|nr:hypothetical protein EDB80DRAFT_29599 [Ilyonectria destructans]